MGQRDQKQRFLVPRVRGEKLATFGLTEPGVGTDAAALQTTARRDGDDYVLNGAKIWISLGDIADHFLVFASVDREKRHKGITAFVVERGMDGFTTGSLKGKLGINANTGQLFSVSPIGQPYRAGGRGLHHLMSAIDQGASSLPAPSDCPACLDASVKYAHERHLRPGDRRHQLASRCWPDARASKRGGCSAGGRLAQNHAV